MKNIFDKSKEIIKKAIADIRMTLPQPYESEIEATLAGLIIKDIPEYEREYLKRTEYE